MNKQINQDQIQRILITRTDRIGDVVLSTPVIESVRKRFPNAFIAMMVAPLTECLVQGNPFLDEVIVYDKKGSERSWLGTWKFSKQLKNFEFDLVIHLHPNNRSHWVSYLAKIPVRIGYRYKNFRLLTHTVGHLKQKGEKHESEYNFDLLSLLNIPVPENIKCTVSVQDQATTQWGQRRKQHHLEENQYFVLNPGASCSSKMWPPSRFAELADLLIQKYQIPVVFMGSQKEAYLAEKIKGWMTEEPIILSGIVSLEETVCMIKQARLLISNDSGPVHIASAFEIPVISLFGRNQPGLSPTRWKPLGKSSFFIHKDVGCQICWAHECPFSFVCLDEIQVREVVEIVEKLKTYSYC